MILNKDPSEKRNLVNVLVFNTKKYLQIKGKYRQFLYSHTAYFYGFTV